MIHSVTIKDSAKTPVAWMPKVPFLATAGTVIEFRPGLNILFGPNGSGKTTLILALARMFHCEQGGVPTITHDSLRELELRGSPLANHKLNALEGLEVKHDGRIIGHFDPNKTVGVMGGAFDDDFMDEGLRSIMVRGSAGQLHTDKMIRVLNRKPGPPDDKVGSHGKPGDVWYDMHAAAVAAMQANVPASPGDQPTWFLDEPERSLDITARANLWASLSKGGNTRQLVLASHDPIGLWLMSSGAIKAHFIETKPGYLKECREVLDMLAPPERAPRATQAPAPLPATPKDV